LAPLPVAELAPVEDPERLSLNNPAKFVREDLERLNDDMERLFADIEQHRVSNAEAVKADEKLQHRVKELIERCKCLPLSDFLGTKAALKRLEESFQRRKRRGGIFGKDR